MPDREVDAVSGGNGKSNGRPRPASACPAGCAGGEFPQQCEARFAAMEKLQDDMVDVLDWTAQHVEVLVVAAGGHQRREQVGLARPRPRLKR